VRPEVLRHKALEPVLVIGRNRLRNLDIRLRVKGGGQVSQIYGAHRQRAVHDVGCCQPKIPELSALNPCSRNANADPWGSTTTSSGLMVWGSSCGGTFCVGVMLVCFGRHCVAAAIRQALAKAVVAFYQKCECWADELPVLEAACVCLQRS
jgi:ribosomal protein S9